jgi:hypothetical protein
MTLVHFKLVKKRRKEQNLPDSYLQTATERKESRKNRQKIGAFSKHCGFHELYK